MPSPRKRHFRSQVGRILAKGVTTATESDFTAAQLDNLFEIGAYGHDGTSGFTHGATGSAKKLGQGSLDEDAGLENVAALAASGRHNVAGWDTDVVRYYLSDDTALEGMTEANPAKATSGILHCPAGPDAKLVPGLEDVSKGSQIKFWIFPTGWVDGQTLTIYTESGHDGVSAGNEDINIHQGDNDAELADYGNDTAANTTIDVDWHANNDAKGVYVVIDNNSTSLVEHKGWHVAWDMA